MESKDCVQLPGAPEVGLVHGGLGRRTSYAQVRKLLKDVLISHVLIKKKEKKVYNRTFDAGFEMR